MEDSITVRVERSLRRFPTHKGLWRNLFSYLDRRSQRRADLIREKMENNLRIAQLRKEESVLTQLSKNCASNKHKVSAWKKVGEWGNKSAYTDKITEKWINLIGKCDHCGCPVSVDLYTLGPKVPIATHNIDFS